MPRCLAVSIMCVFLSHTRIQHLRYRFYLIHLVGASHSISDSKKWYFVADDHTNLRTLDTHYDKWLSIPNSDEREWTTTKMKKKNLIDTHAWHMCVQYLHFGCTRKRYAMRWDEWEAERIWMMPVMRWYSHTHCMKSVECNDAMSPRELGYHKRTLFARACAHIADTSTLSIAHRVSPQSNGA